MIRRAAPSSGSAPRRCFVGAIFERRPQAGSGMSGPEKLEEHCSGVSPGA